MSDRRDERSVHLRVHRYSMIARINHWIVAVSFVLLMLSGLSLFHPNLYWLAGLFGGGATVRWLHPWIGLVLAVSFAALFVRFFWNNLPEVTDAVWVARIRDVLRAREDRLPEIGKYNAGQKFVFWAQAVLVCTLFVTGLGLWERGLPYLEGLLGFKATIEQIRIAALLHAAAAVLAITIWVIHVYAAIWVRGTFAAMTRGFVTGGWG